MSYNNKKKLFEGYVYVIQNDIYPNKYYIGITIQTPEIRWRMHKHQIKRDNDKLHNAMRKYGIEHFALDTIATYSKKNKDELIALLKEMEIYFISQFDSYYNGYNCTLGGDLITINSKPICQYDLDGNFISEYQSVESLKSILNITSTSAIYDCCLHASNTTYAYGYIWKYKDDYTPLPSLTESQKSEAIIRENSRHEIIKYNYKGEVIKIYKNVDDVLLDNPNITRIQLIKVCTGRKVYADMHIYRFINDSLTKYKTYNEKPKLVEQLDNQNNVLKVYPSCREAAKDNNLVSAQISNICLKRYSTDTVGGYKWRYPENYYSVLKAI